MAGHDHGLSLRGVEAGNVYRHSGIGEVSQSGTDAEGQHGEETQNNLKMASCRWHSP